MKSLLLLISFLAIISVNVSASDTIVKVNGDTIVCTILSKKGNNVEFSGFEGQSEYTGLLPKSQIAHINYGTPQKNALDSINQFTFGFGLGFAYGGAGINLAYYPVQNFGITAGVGYNIIGIGANAGLRVQTNRRLETAAIGYLQLLYGYNTVIYVDNAGTLNKVFYGFTPGAGIDFLLGARRSTVFTIGLNVPIRPSTVDEYFTYLKEERSVVFENEPSSVALTLGLKFYIDNN